MKNLFSTKQKEDKKESREELPKFNMELENALIQIYNGIVQISQNQLGLNTSLQMLNDRLDRLPLVERKEEDKK